MPACLFVSTGCASRGNIQTISVSAKQLPLDGPLIAKITFTQGYFWIDENNALCIAVRGHRWSILGKRFETEAIASFVLPEAPAGEQLDYRVDRNTARIRTRQAWHHTRSASTSGVLTIFNYNYGATSLNARFRFFVRQQTFNVLTGWGGDATVLVIGEVRALRNRSAGEALRDQTETGPMAR